MTFGLAAVLGLGVGAGLKAGQVKEAKAGDAVRLYLDMSSNSDWYSSSATFKVHTWNSANGDKYFPATKAANAYYYADVDLATYSSGGGYRFSRFDSEGKTEWTKGAWNDYAGGVNNYYKVDSGSYTTTTGTWSSVETSWQVLGAQNGEWTALHQDIEIDLTIKFDSDGLQLYTRTLTLEKNAQFKVKSAGGVYYGFDKVDNGAGGARKAGNVVKAADGDDPNIKVVNGGIYEIYVKPLAADANKIWLQENSDESAKNFSNDFLTAMRAGGVCGTTDESQKRDNKTAVEAIWSTWKTNFEALTTGAKSSFGSLSDENVVAARKLYVHCRDRYSLTAWTGAPATASNVVTNPINNNSDNALTIAIVAASAISLLAVGGFFFIRKRKESK